MNQIIPLLIIAVWGQPRKSEDSHSHSSDNHNHHTYDHHDHFDYGYRDRPSYHYSDNRVYNERYGIYDHHHENYEGGFMGFIITIFIFIGFIVLAVVCSLAKGRNNPNNVNNNNQDNQQDQQIHFQTFLSKRIKEGDEINALLDGILIQFEKSNIELSYIYNNEIIQQEVLKKNLQRNQDVITVNIDGQDQYGKWTQNGIIIVNQNHIIECLMRKQYDNKELNGNDNLFYQGTFDSIKSEFKGKWYYQKAESQSGYWTMFLRKTDQSAK